MKYKYKYLPFIFIFLVSIIVISLANNYFPVAIKSNIKEEVKLESIDSSQKDWYFKSNNNERPIFPDYVKEYIKNYSIYVMGKEEKVLYMTFNCGYEYNNYTLDILEILKEQEIKAAFFVTGGYVKNNPEIVKKMINEGHIVGNHGYTHATLTNLSNDELIKEFENLRVEFKNITGEEMSKYVRPASGIYSENILNISSQLGYKTVFWSLAYKDWDTSDQPGKSKAYSQLINHVHNGCIVMLHTVSKSNKEALKEAIIKLKEDGYIFKSLDEFI